MNRGDQITVEMRLAAIEDKLDRLLAYHGIDDERSYDTYRTSRAVSLAPESIMDTELQISALIEAGKRIQAIKVYRQATGAGLKEAKDAIDAMQRGMQAGGGRR